MNIYELFSGTDRGEPVLVAILRGEIGEIDCEGAATKAADFFLPSTTDIEKIGEIQVTGDIGSLPTYWTFDDH